MNSSGRAIIRVTTQVAIPVTDATATCTGCSPRIEPKRTLIPTVPDPALRAVV